MAERRSSEAKEATAAGGTAETTESASLTITQVFDALAKTRNPSDQSASRSGRATPERQTEGADATAGGKDASERLLADAQLTCANPNDGKCASDRGLALIKHFEGLRLKPYKDARGQMAIGYGHHIKEGEEELLNGITVEKAEALLKQDLGWTQRVVADAVDIPLTQSQFDALVSFSFNVGPANFRRSTLLKKLNNGDLEGASKEFERWVKGGRPPRTLPGLVTRRRAERELFTTAG